tara:strand:+ start:433 stop:1803 length:1371 start_codon:yes stop_codon:yes gene_type:complete
MGLLPASNLINRSVAASANNTAASSGTPLESYFNTLSLQTPPEKTLSVIRSNDVDNTTSTNSTTPKSQVIYSDYCFRLLTFLNKKEAYHLNQVSKDQNIEVDQILNESHYPTSLPKKLDLNGFDMIQEAKERIPSTQRLVNVVNDKLQWDPEFIIHCLKKTISNKSYTVNKQNILYHVAKSGDMTLLSLLKYYKLIHTDDARADNNRAFRVAALNGHVEVLRFLKDEFGLTDDNARFNNNWAFRVAALNGHVEVLRFLRNGFGLTLDDARADHNSALRSASENGYGEVLRFLRNGFGLTLDDARADNNQALRSAAENGHVEVLRFLKDGFGLTADDARSWNNLALKLAAVNGHTEVLHCLKYEFKLTTEDASANDNNAFKYASQQGHVDVLRVLKDDFGLTTADARTDNNYALRWAAVHRQVEVLRVLKDDFGLTPENEFRLTVEDLRAYNENYFK